jgi:hypothetical protein
MASALSLFSLVVGIALLLAGIGFIVLALGALSKGSEKEAGEQQTRFGELRVPGTQEREESAERRRTAVPSGNSKKPCMRGLLRGGRYWARTSDPQLVELVLSQLS